MRAMRLEASTHKRLFLTTPLLAIGLLATGCATTAKYNAKVRTWIGKDTEALTQAWGQPDATEQPSTGDKILVYSRLKRKPLSYEQAQHGAGEPGVYIKCATYFEIDGTNRVSNVTFTGDECTSKD